MTGNALGQCQTSKFVANDPADFDLFGTSVGVSGDFAIVGARGDDSPGAADAGAAYIFARSGLAWTQVTKLTASDRAAGDNFGQAVAIDGDYAAVGSPNDGYSGFNALGSVYIFHRINGVWTQEFNILAPASGLRGNFNRFGNSVKLSGNTIAIAAQYEDSSRGAAYVFVRSGTSWTLQQRFQPAGMPGSAFFGSEVGLDGDTLVVGAQGDNTGNGFATGSAYVFGRSGTVWSQQAKLVGTSTTSSDQFGRFVGVGGDRCVICSPLETASGVSYVYRKVGASWVQEQRLLPAVPASTSYYGMSLAISHDATRMIVGFDHAGPAIDGSVDVLTRSGNTWTRLTTLRSSDASNAHNFAISAALDADTVIVGDEENDFGGFASPGAAYAFMPFTNGNDLCANASGVVAGSYVGCTSGMGAHGSATCGNSNSTEDVYYTYTASCTQTVNFNTAGSEYDTVLSIHSGCPATSSNLLDCNDDIALGTLYSNITMQVNKGQTVVIRVSGFNGADGVFQLNVSESGLGNDRCSAAAHADVGQTPFGNCQATTDGQTFSGPCFITNVHNDLWYLFDSGCNGTAVVDTCDAATDFDTTLAVYDTDSCIRADSAHLIGCSDDDCSGTRSRVEFDATAGRTYLIRVGGFSATSRGSGILNINFTSRCPADYNLDGGIDGSDPQAFFADWTMGSPNADVNCDGGVDGSDVQYFFDKWESGGCF
ncbi:MAG: hypothetical protein JSR77_06905 [Planctomycetes bacterium]|nr:hypothetical protein [Planctomycetota bacterium]